LPGPRSTVKPTVSAGSGPAAPHGTVTFVHYVDGTSWSAR
jgi:hypothetical protein